MQNVVQVFLPLISIYHLCETVKQMHEFIPLNVKLDVTQTTRLNSRFQLQKFAAYSQLKSGNQFRTFYDTNFTDNIARSTLTRCSK